MGISPLNNRGGFSNRRIMLSPEKGAENLVSISRDVRAWQSKMKTAFKFDYAQYIDPGKPENRKLIRETLELISRVLTSCPLTGTDGLPGKRSYFACPMYFGEENANLLRELGDCINPANFDPAKIKRILKNRYEMYKLEIKPSSGLIGFNFDAIGTPAGISAFAFTCYEVRPNNLKTIADVTVPLVKLDDKFTLKLDLNSYEVNYHDIDRYN